MAGERLRALVHKVAAGLDWVEELLVRLEGARGDISEVVEGRLAELKSGIAELRQKFGELEVAVEDEDEPAAEP